MLIDELTQQELRDLLVKNWMAHDGSWFLNCYLRLGIDEANKLNKAAIKTLAPMEVKRVKNLSQFRDKKKLENYEEVKEFMKDAFSVLKGDFMDFTISFPEENCIHWEMNRCFAYEGMKRLGVQEQYECGVIYRVSRWLKELGIKHKIKPRIKKCLLNTQGKCEGDFLIRFY
ncbi:MAG: hypothetical protein BAJALOKI1v1_1360005 [Promethearchaeota archaeon]|nr:MAG: hypothetical protein BAJALOKI1v1_1360005 [Candidatus Lokiarchaeota archaeon]